MQETIVPTDLGNGFFRLGSSRILGAMQPNTYLLNDDSESVLFGPGSLITAEEILASLPSNVGRKQILWVVVSSQDPDAASALPVLEREGLRFQVVTHWRTWNILRFMGLQSSPWIINEHGWLLTMKTGRTLQFLPTPYLHQPGAFATWDRASGTLVSGSLFSSYSPRFELYAQGEDWLRRMEEYHSVTMPSHDILAPVMRSIALREISQILPGQGSILGKDQIAKALASLESLEVGELLLPVCREDQKNDAYRNALDELIPLLMRELAAEAREELCRTFGLQIDETSGKHVSILVHADRLWDDLSLWILHKAGTEVFRRLKPHLLAIADRHGITKPAVFSDTAAVPPQEIERLKLELKNMKKLNEELSRAISTSSDRTVRDTVTGLYSELFYKSFIDEEAVVRIAEEHGRDSILAVFGIDENLSQIELKYGSREVEALLRGVAAIISMNIPKLSLAFRLFGATMAAWFPSSGFDETIALLEKIRVEVANSRSFVEPITISIGVARLSEVAAIQTDLQKLGSDLTDLGVKRLRMARRRGGNMVYFASDSESEMPSLGRLLVVDDDEVNIDVLKTYFAGLGYAVFTAIDGQQALSIISKEVIDVVITELMLPKIDAYRMRESMLAKTSSKDIPMVIMSSLKTENSVRRAYNLGISHYLQKPVMLEELLGIVKNLLQTCGTGAS